MVAKNSPNIGFCPKVKVVSKGIGRKFCSLAWLYCTQTTGKVKLIQLMTMSSVALVLWWIIGLINELSKLHTHNVQYPRSAETNFSIITQKMRCYEMYSMWDCCVLFSGADLAFIFTILLTNSIHSAKFIISLLNPNCSKQFNGD